MTTDSGYDRGLSRFAKFHRERQLVNLLWLLSFRSTGLASTGTGPIDRKPAFWEYGEMKTTLDLPDKLMHEVKIRAVHEHKKLKHAIAELLEKGMAADRRVRGKLPKPVKLRGGAITTKELEAAINWGRD